RDRRAQDAGLLRPTHSRHGARRVGAAGRARWTAGTGAGGARRLVPAQEPRRRPARLRGDLGHRAGRARADDRARPDHRAHSGAQRHAAEDRHGARAGLIMRSLLLQVLAVTAINLKSMPQRLWLSLSTVVAVALGVIVLLAFLAMANGFQRTLASSGSDDIAIVLRGGSQAEINSTVSRDQVRLIEDGPGIARGADGKPLVSPELYLVVDGVKRSSGTKANLPLRGIGEQGAALRRNITLTAGRMFERGANEIVGGKGIVQGVRGFELGQTGAFGTTRRTLVGIFDAGGSVFESELWADLPVVQALFNRPNFVQTVRARLENPASLARLKAYVDDDPRLKLDTKSEAAYFVDQSSQTSDLIQKLGWPLAIAMAFGALAGALNTMYSSVAARAVEIATLRAIGFGGFP